MVSWRKKKGILMQKLTLLKDNEELLEAGKMEEILGRLEKKLGQTKESLRKLIAKL